MTIQLNSSLPTHFGTSKMLSILASFRFVLSSIPVVIKATLLHALGLSQTSSKWDFKTALTVTLLRFALGNAPPSTILEQQAMFLKDPGVKGNIWVSKQTFPAPEEDDLRKLLLQIIKISGNGDKFQDPVAETVSGEWVGYRANLPDGDENLSEAERYKHLVEEKKSKITILYFHGGSLYLMDPVSTRLSSGKAATLTKGQVFSVRYRPAPQHPFPAALLDGLIAYMSLLYPPSGSVHDAISASSIVFGGDSGGGNIATALLQTILSIHRAFNGDGHPQVLFHGQMRSVPIPAGLALGSPSFDLTRCFHWSDYANLYDYLPHPSTSPVQSPPCKIWPVKPPRPDLYCEGQMLCHPLVSPLAASSWKNSPPIFISSGEETVAQEGKIVARKAAKQGVKVVWEQYEAMPHCFPLIFDASSVSDMAFRGWTEFVDMAVNNPEAICTKGVYITPKRLERHSVEVRELTELNDSEVDKAMEEARLSMIARFS